MTNSGQHDPLTCVVCRLSRYVEQRITAEGLDPALFDAAVVIAGRLATVALASPEVCAELAELRVNSLTFWRAVYGPAYPALVTA